MRAARVIQNGKDVSHEPMTFGDGSISIGYQRAQFKSQMVMVRFHTDSAIENEDRDRAEYIYSQLLEQCKNLSRKFGFSVIT